MGEAIRAAQNVMWLRSEQPAQRARITVTAPHTLKMETPLRRDSPVGIAVRLVMRACVPDFDPHPTIRCIGQNLVPAYEVTTQKLMATMSATTST